MLHICYSQVFGEFEGIVLKQGLENYPWILGYSLIHSKVSSSSVQPGYGVLSVPVPLS